MRKIAVLLLAIVLLGVSFTPVLAMPQAALAPLSLSVVAPTTAYQGETVQVSIVARNNNRRPALVKGWRISFSKSVVAAVEVTKFDGRIVDRSNETDFVFVWNGVILNGGGVAKIDFEVTLRSDISRSQTLVSAENTWTLHQAMIQIQEPRLTVTSSAPDVVSRGGVIFFVDLTLTNETNLDLPFDMAMTVFHAGTDGSTNYSFSGGEVYWLEGNRTGITLSWRGTVPAGESLTLSVQTASGNYPGTYPIFGLVDRLDPSNLFGTKLIIII